MSLNRNCPNCKTKIFYTLYSNFRRAEREHTLCKRCMKNKGKFSRGHKSWNIGISPPHSVRKKISKSLKGNVPWNSGIWPREKVFVRNSKCSRPIVRDKFLEEREYKCEECGNAGVWRKKILTLHLHHKNGINNDNRLKNLCWLCPNCHQQTENWGLGNGKIRNNRFER